MLDDNRENTEVIFQQETSPHSRTSQMPPRIRQSSLMKAHVALLEHEVIQPAQGEHFPSVSYHLPALQKWHAEHTGWYIEQHNNMFRLLHTPSILASGNRKNRLQESRDFACLSWILSYAARKQLTGYGVEQQFLMSQLAQYIVEQAQNAEGKEIFSFERRADRFSIMRALRYLEDIQGLRKVAGQTEEWVDRRVDMLYEFTPVVSLLIIALDIDAIASIQDRLQDTSTFRSAPLSPTVPPLVRAWRSLIIGPVFYRFDDPEGFTVLYEHAEEFERIIMETFGWLLEVNADYACIVRSGGTSAETTPLLHLGSATDQIVALLCATLRAEVADQRLLPDDYGCVQVTISDIERLFTMYIRPRYGMYWGKEAQETSVSGLLIEVYKKMRHIGLFRGPNSFGEVLLLPLVARFAPTYIKTQREGNTREKKRSEEHELSSIEEPPSPTLWSDLDC